MGGKGKWDCAHIKSLMRILCQRSKQSENQWEIEQMQSEEISQRVHEKWMRETTKSQYLSRQKRKSTQRLHRRKSGCSVRVRANVKEVNGRNITASAIVPSHAGHITNEYSSNQIDILLVSESLHHLKKRDLFDYRYFRFKKFKREPIKRCRMQRFVHT